MSDAYVVAVGEGVIVGRGVLEGIGVSEGVSFAPGMLGIVYAAAAIELSHEYPPAKMQQRSNKITPRTNNWGAVIPR
jgi:hypothetical protein